MFFENMALISPSRIKCVECQQTNGFLSLALIVLDYQPSQARLHRINGQFAEICPVFNWNIKCVMAYSWLVERGLIVAWGSAPRPPTGKAPEEQGSHALSVSSTCALAWRVWTCVSEPVTWLIWWQVLDMPGWRLVTVDIGMVSPLLDCQL